MVFWHNDEHASALFYDLLARSERDAFDDDFLARLAARREAASAGRGLRPRVSARTSLPPGISSTMGTRRMRSSVRSARMPDAP